MHLNVNGNNNRTAGRDYIELNPNRICPECEIRHLIGDREYCRHCEEEYLAHQEMLMHKERRNKLSLGMLVSGAIIFLGSIWVKSNTNFIEEPYWYWGVAIGMILMWIGTDMREK